MTNTVNLKIEKEKVEELIPAGSIVLIGNPSNKTAYLIVTLERGFTLINLETGNRLCDTPIRYKDLNFHSVTLDSLMEHIGQDFEIRNDFDIVEDVKITVEGKIRKFD